MLAFFILPITQVVLLCLLVCLTLLSPYGSPEFIGLNLFLAVGCVLVDVGLFFSFNRFRMRNLAQQKASMLQEQHDRYLAEYRIAVRRIETTSCLRHNLSNEAMVAASLVERGETEEAKRFLDDLIRHYEKIGDALEGCGDDLRKEMMREEASR